MSSMIVNSYSLNLVSRILLRFSSPPQKGVGKQIEGFGLLWGNS